MIRLTLLTLAGLVCAMVIWGNEPAETTTAVIATEVLSEPESRFVAGDPPVARHTAEVETAASATRRVTIDLTKLRPANDLLVFAAADAPADAARPVATPVKPTKDTRLLVVTGTHVNLRAGPSITLDIIGGLQRGAKAQFLAEADDGWVQIRDIASGRIGFMSGDFLTALN